MKKIRNSILYICLIFLLSACGVDEAYADNQTTDIKEDVSYSDDIIDGSTESNTESSAGGDVNEYSVVYNWNNADLDAKPRSGRLTDDWNGDGMEDVLTIEVTEQEGSEIIKKLELSMSGSDASYVIMDQYYYFIDIISGNFDSDADMEVLLVFDMRYAGGNGTIGIQLLDFNGSEYVNIADDFFTGYVYSVDVKDGENGSYLISRADGEEMIIKKDYIYESAIGAVTGFYFLDVLEKDGVNYIRIKQYVAGEDMTDHVGDVVSIFGVSDGELTLLDEKVEAFLSPVPAQSESAGHQQRTKKDEKMSFGSKGIEEFKKIKIIRYVIDFTASVVV